MGVGSAVFSTIMETRRFKARPAGSSLPSRLRLERLEIACQVPSRGNTGARGCRRSSRASLPLQRHVRERAARVHGLLTFCVGAAFDRHSHFQENRESTMTIFQGFFRGRLEGVALS